MAYLGLSLVGNSWLVESGEMLGTANRIPLSLSTSHTLSKHSKSQRRHNFNSDLDKEAVVPWYLVLGWCSHFNVPSLDIVQRDIERESTHFSLS